MWIIRWPIGRLILLLNAIFSPKAPKRSAEQQAVLDAATQHLSLYQLAACPFCVKVRRAMKRHGLNVELRTINKDAQHFDDLITHGGKRTVPCLRIAKPHDDEHQQATWLYESRDIVAYLEQIAG